MDRETEVIMEDLKQDIEILKSEIQRLKGRGQKTVGDLRMEDPKVQGKIAKVSWDSAAGALRFEEIR